MPQQPVTDILWLNILMGRIAYSCLNDKQFLTVLQDMLKKKLNAIKLPTFMENVCVTNVNLGDTAPTFDNIIPPMCDERGLWFEADCSYEGLMHMTISTKLNLMRLKKEEQHKKKRSGSKRDGDANDSDNRDSDEIENIDVIDTDDEDISDKTLHYSAKVTANKPKMKASIYDSDAESSGASSTESESLSQSYADTHHSAE